MVYLTDNDLKTHAFTQFITESDADFLDARNESELQNIEIIKSKLGARYDTAVLFNIPLYGAQDYAIGDNGRHPLIVRVLTKMVIYDIINRNSARKVPSDIKDDYTWCMKWLDSVMRNHENPEGMPPLTNSDGDAIPGLNYGNNTNDDFYI
jgi:hypothetical protein